MQQTIPTKDLEQTCLEAAEAGALKAMAFFNKTFEVKYKGEEKHAGTIVTEADTAAEKEVRKVIIARYPDHAIVGEEEGGIDGNEYAWFIDPVDGTGNFSRGLPIWGTLVGVAFDSKPMAGAMVFPALGRTFYASKGNGAFADGKKIHASSLPLAEGLVLAQVSHRPEYREKVTSAVKEFSGTIGGVRILGCTGYEGALIAEGKAELKIKFKTTAWDSCAAAITVTEAGGVYNSFQGTPWTTKDKNAIAAASEAVFEEAFKRLQKL